MRFAIKANLFFIECVKNNEVGDYRLNDLSEKLSCSNIYQLESS